jgi:hypothetical protein
VVREAGSEITGKWTVRWCVKKVVILLVHGQKGGA